ncbi:MAG: lycopene cyclase domain-containing protein [Patescibacteria group bacterium]|jgi:lycopene cyclase domain-containing protein
MNYLSILVIILLISVFLQWKFKFRIYNSWKQRIITILILLIVGIAWDSFAVYSHHWYFDYSGSGLSGIKIGNLPIEEYIFMFIQPYFIFTVYKSLNRSK